MLNFEIPENKVKLDLHNRLKLVDKSEIEGLSVRDLLEKCYKNPSDQEHIKLENIIAVKMNNNPVSMDTLVNKATVSVSYWLQTQPKG